VGDFSPVIHARHLQQPLFPTVEAAYEAQSETRAGDGPENPEVYALPGRVAEVADGVYLSCRGLGLQGGETVVVHGGAAQEGIGPYAPGLLQQVSRGAGDEVGAQEELALGHCYVLRDARKLLVIVRAVVEYEPGVEAGDQIQRRPRGRVGDHEGTGTHHFPQVAQHTRDEKPLVRPHERLRGGRGGERRVYEEVFLPPRLVVPLQGALDSREHVA
jgi:hypothetical protein